MSIGQLIEESLRVEISKMSKYHKKSDKGFHLRFWKEYYHGFSALQNEVSEIKKN